VVSGQDIDATVDAVPAELVTESYPLAKAGRRSRRVPPYAHLGDRGADRRQAGAPGGQRPSHQPEAADRDPVALREGCSRLSWCEPRGVM